MSFVDSMQNAVKEFFGNYANFNGRTSRKNYWLVVLFSFVASLVLGIPGVIGAIFDAKFLIGLGKVITTLYSLVILVPSIAMSVRRFHDIGKPGTWYLFCMVGSLCCGIGGIAGIIFMCLPSEPDNQYGPSPMNTGFGYNNMNQQQPYNQQQYNQQQYNQQQYNQQQYNQQQHYDNNNQQF